MPKLYSKINVIDDTDTPTFYASHEAKVIRNNSELLTQIIDKKICPISFDMLGKLQNRHNQKSKSYRVKDEITTVLLAMTRGSSGRENRVSRIKTTRKLCYRKVRVRAI